MKQTSTVVTNNSATAFVDNVRSSCVHLSLFGLISSIFSNLIFFAILIYYFCFSKLFMEDIFKLFSIEYLLKYVTLIFIVLAILYVFGLIRRILFLIYFKKNVKTNTKSYWMIFLLIFTGGLFNMVGGFLLLNEQ